MTPILSDVIPFMQCSHEFSWPRRLPDGEYYQVCLRCGAEYGYDWNTMRRTEKVSKTAAERVSKTAAVGSRSHTQAQSGWRPRARRLAVEIPVRYRLDGSNAWSEGVVRNISRTGVLFVGTHEFSQGERLELIFEMPEEISGQAHSEVLCQARVARMLPVADSSEQHAVAVVMAGYEFLHKRKLPRNAEARA